MNTLILDTSSNFLYLYIETNLDKYEIILEGRNNHSEKLMDKISEGLNKLNLKVSDLEKIILGIGPGSYTGLRVALTVCKMFSYLKNIPLFITSSLNILGSGYLNTGGKFIITNIAKKDHVYYKLVEIKNGEIINETSDNFSSISELDQFINDGYKLINEANYKFDPEIIKKLKLTKVDNVHDLTPNYIREALS